MEVICFLLSRIHDVAAYDLRPAISAHTSSTGKQCGGRSVHPVPLPRPLPSPLLNGRKAVAAPHRRVVIIAALLLSAKCTSAPRGKSSNCSAADCPFRPSGGGQSGTDPPRPPRSACNRSSASTVATECIRSRRRVSLCSE